MRGEYRQKTQKRIVELFRKPIVSLLLFLRLYERNSPVPRNGRDHSAFAPQPSTPLKYVH